MLGSVGSTSIIMSLNESLRRLNPSLLKYVKSYTQSDDGMDQTALPCITSANIFKNIDISKVINNLEGFKVSDKQFICQDISQPKEFSTKLFFLLRLFCCKLFSQRPSLLKTSFGFISEMLQEIHTKDGTQIPLIRYTSSLCAKLGSLTLTNSTLMEMLC